MRTVEAAENANLTLGKQNDALVQGFDVAIGTPLRTELAASLGEVPVILRGIATTLGQTNVPLDQAAQRMSTIAGRFKETSDTLTTEVKASAADTKRHESATTEGLSSLRRSVQVLGERVDRYSESVRERARTPGSYRSPEANPTNNNEKKAGWFKKIKQRLFRK